MSDILPGDLMRPHLPGDGATGAPEHFSAHSKSHLSRDTELVCCHSANERAGVWHIGQ